MKKLISVLAVAVVLLSLSAVTIAQAVPKAVPKYDPKTEVELKNLVVQDVKEVTLPNGQNRYRLVVKVGDQVQEICLSPKAYLDTMETTFAKGDTLDTVVGSKVDNNGQPLILAREVVKGNNTLVLRDKKGEPVWTWMEKKTAEGK